MSETTPEENNPVGAEISVCRHCGGQIIRLLMDDLGNAKWLHRQGLYEWCKTTTAGPEVGPEGPVGVPG